MQDSGSLAVFKVTAGDQGHYKGPSGAFVTPVTFLVFLYECVWGGGANFKNGGKVKKT